jgi:uncharacterized membrane protein (GlpM family)
MERMLAAISSIDVVILSQVVLSAVIGGVWVGIAVIVAERYGGKIGGLLSGFPSTVACALLFVGWTSGSDSLLGVTRLLPLTFSAYAVFVASYVFFAGQILRRESVVLASLGVWLVVLLFLMSLGSNNVFIPVVAWAGALALAFAMKVFEGAEPPSVDSVPLKSSRYATIWRIGLAGLIVGVTVLASKLSTPDLAALFVSFPAAALVTLVIIHATRGLQHVQFIAPRMMISGLLNVVFLGFSVGWLLPFVGVTLSVFISLALTLIFAVFTLCYTKAYS